MTYDYYNCPYEPDTGMPPCGQQPECKDCLWFYILTDPPENDDFDDFIVP